MEGKRQIAPSAPLKKIKKREGTSIEKKGGGRGARMEQRGAGAKNIETDP